MRLAQIGNVTKVHLQLPTLVFITLALQQRFFRNFLSVVSKETSKPRPFSTIPVRRWSGRADIVTVFCIPTSSSTVAPYPGYSLSSSERNYTSSFKIRWIFADRSFRRRFETMRGSTNSHQTRKKWLVSNPLPASEKCARKCDSYYLLRLEL